METELDKQIRYDRARKRVKSIRGFYMHFFAYLLVNTFLLVIKWVNLQPNEEFFTFNTFSTPFFWGIGLAFHALGTFGKQVYLNDDWEQRKIKELMDKHDTATGTKKDKWE